MKTRKPYPKNVSDEEWPSWRLSCAGPRDASQHVHDLREAFDALRWILRQLFEPKVRAVCLRALRPAVFAYATGPVLTGFEPVC